MPIVVSNYGSHSVPRYAVSNGAEVCRSVATGKHRREHACDNVSEPLIFRLFKTFQL